MDGAPCPFCGAPAQPPRCPSCGRDPTASRRACRRCGGMTPISERACVRCGRRQRSDLPWKIALIVVLFLVALAVSVAVRLG